jgi:hypothetical protein
MTKDPYRVAITEGLPPVGPHRNRSEQTGEIDRQKSAERHVLENILAHPLAGRVLGWLAATDRHGRSRLDRTSETYDRPNVPLDDRLRWALPHLLIDLSLGRLGADKEAAKAKLFHHHPTVRALTLTARSIARYGLTAPQRFVAPLLTVWNITRACNLDCQHCYQNATHKPQRGELFLGERIGVADELATAGVPFLAIAGGEPLVCKDLWPVVEYANKRAIHLTVATNGATITPDVAARLVESGCLTPPGDRHGTRSAQCAPAPLILAFPVVRRRGQAAALQGASRILMVSGCRGRLRGCQLRLWKSHFLTSGQNSSQALLARTPPKPSALRKRASCTLASLLTRQEFERKLFPKTAM